MQTEIYADSIGEITVTGTIMRLDLVSLSTTMRDDMGQPVPEQRMRVIMSLEGFANSFEVLQNAMNGLIEAGAIRRNDPVPAPQPAAKLAASNGNTSPNFV